MKELSSKLKEKSLAEFDMVYASKKPLETKGTLPSRSIGPKVRGCGQMPPAVNHSSKPKIMSANMKEKLSELKREGAAEYSAKQKKNVTFDLDKPRFCGRFADALQKEIEEDMQARSSLHELHQKFDGLQIEGSSSRFDHSPRSRSSISSEKHLDKVHEEGFAGSEGVAQYKDDFVLIIKAEKLGLGKHKDAEDADWVFVDTE